MQPSKINVVMKSQPDDTSCGPTSLHSIYNFYGKHTPLKEIISQVNMVQSGGTLAPLLGLHALSQNFKSKIYTFNLDIFDPTWFYPRRLSYSKIIHKLVQQNNVKTDLKSLETSHAYIQYIQAGGELLFKDLSIGLLRRYFEQNIPVIAGLSATYLYRCAREYETQNGESVYDDIKGEPCGHFVVLCGYDQTKRHIIVADPHRENPISHDNYYKVSAGRLINSIMLGIITQDANILVIEEP